MQIPQRHLPLETVRAAVRLDAVVNCSSMMEYASTLQNPAELEFISRMITRLCLSNDCQKTDVAECVSYVDTLSAAAYGSTKTMTMTKTKAKAKAKKTDTKKKVRELMTFRKNGILDGHIRLFYNNLVKDGWILPCPSEDDFLALFSGRRSNCRIVWTGKYGKGTLMSLFGKLIADGVITLAAGFTLSHVLEGHFIDKKGAFLTNLDKGDKCNDKALPFIDEQLHIMQLTTGRRDDDADDDDDDDDFNSGYGDEYDPFDNNDLHLHNRHGM